MVRVGLTGVIGAGKSEALKAFARLGCQTASADQFVHEIQREPRVRKTLVARWGEGILKNGEVDRAEVAQIVFNDGSELEWLEGLIFPLVGGRLVKWQQALQPVKGGKPVAVVEIPLLFESGIDGFFDCTVAVVGEENLRRARLRGRGQLDGIERDSRQLSQKEKARRSNYVVNNNGSLEELEGAVAEVLNSILMEFSGSSQ